MKYPELSEEKWDYIAKDTTLAQARAWVDMFTCHRFEELQSIALANEVCRHAVYRWFQYTIVFFFDEHFDIANAWIHRLIYPRDTGVGEACLISLLSFGLTALSDEDKLRVFEGACPQKAHQKLHQLIQKEAWYYLVSPAWFGRHGSALREAALRLGVEPFPGMLHSALLDEFPYVHDCFGCHPYAYSAIVLGKMRAQIAPRIRPPDIKNKTVKEIVIHKRANPRDALLALCFQELSPIPLDVRLLANTQIAPVSEHERMRIQQQAAIYLQLFSLDELIEHMDTGVLPGNEDHVGIELPPLGLES